MKLLEVAKARDESLHKNRNLNFLAMKTVAVRFMSLVNRCCVFFRSSRFQSLQSPIFNMQWKSLSEGHPEFFRSRSKENAGSSCPKSETTSLSESTPATNSFDPECPLKYSHISSGLVVSLQNNNSLATSIVLCSIET